MNVFWIFFLCGLVGVILRFAIVYGKNPKAFDVKYNITQGILSILFIAVASALLYVTVKYPWVVYAAGVLVGILSYYWIQKINKIKG